MNEQVVDNQVKKRNLTPFWILLAVCGLPYLFSWIYFANVDRLPEADTTNRGELIEPLRPVDNLSLAMLDGSIFDTNQLKGNWTLMTAGPSQCDESCLKNVYYMRQVRRLMGEERKRIRRLFVLTDADQAETFKTKVAPYGAMDIVAPEGGDNSRLVKQLVVNGVTPDNRIYIIDPMANLMMVYAPDSDPEDIAKDFRRLLKVTRIGQPKTAG